jgi:hypothetical protein
MSFVMVASTSQASLLSSYPVERIPGDATAAAQPYILPTLTLGSVRRLKILWTRNIGVFVGRTVPIIGEVILAYDVSVISYRSAVHYNQLVKPEDRL